MDTDSRQAGMQEDREFVPYAVQCVETLVLGSEKFSRSFLVEPASLRCRISGDPSSTGGNVVVPPWQLQV